MTETLSIALAVLTLIAAMVTAFMSVRVHLSLSQATAQSESALASAIHLQRALLGLEGKLSQRELNDELTSLEGYFHGHSTDKRMAFILSRLYRRMNRTTDAISVLNKFLQTKNGEVDKDYADALYNRASYHLTQSLEGDPQAKDLAYRDLKASIDLRPENKFEALQDPDFEPVARDPEFRKIVEAR